MPLPQYAARTSSASASKSETCSDGSSASATSKSRSAGRRSLRTRSRARSMMEWVNSVVVPLEERNEQLRALLDGGRLVRVKRHNAKNLEFSLQRAAHVGDVRRVRLFPTIDQHGARQAQVQLFAQA